MALDLAPVVDKLVSHAAASGHFARVNQHEPKNAPGSGLTAAVWPQLGQPARGMSGLNSTTFRVEFRIRIYSNMLAQPVDQIDTTMLTAVSTLLADYSAGFTLGGLVRNVDLLGAAGNPLSWQAGYLTIDQKSYRIVDITVPLVINDVFDQSA